jgi:hypothetical protein
MKKLVAFIKTLIRYEKKVEQITGADIDKLVADRIKQELNDGSKENN